MSQSQSMNITIPRVLGQVSKEVIVRAFRTQQLGRLVDVHRYERVNENGHAYWFAFMQYIPADTPNARTFVQLLKAGKKTFVFYQSSSPWKMDIQFPVLNSNEKRDPFVEVILHVRELARVNPAALVRLPIAAKKGYEVVQGTVVHRTAAQRAGAHSAGAQAPKKTQRRKRQSSTHSDEWMTVGRSTRRSSAATTTATTTATATATATTTTTATAAAAATATATAVRDVEESDCAWEFEPVPSEPYEFTQDNTLTQVDTLTQPQPQHQEDDLTQLLQDIEQTRTAWTNASSTWNAYAPWNSYAPWYSSSTWNAYGDVEWANAWNQILCDA